MAKAIGWLCVAVQLISICTASTDEPLGRNYRKNFNNYQNSHTNNGKILSTSETKISSVSYKPESSGKFSSFVDNSNLKTAASEEEKFSIGLGVLSPSYSQKFGEDGKTKLDFNSDKGGFSYSLTNVVHPHQPGASSSISASSGTAAQSASSVPIATNTLNKVQSEGFVPSQYYNPTASQQPNPQVNIYHKQSADPNAAIYGRLASNNYPVPPSPLNPSPTPSPYAPNPAGLAPIGPPAQQPVNPYAQQPAPAGNPYAPYNPYAAAAALSPAGPFGALSDVEKSFLQTSQIGPQPIAAHQHQLPQPAPSSPSAQQAIQPQPSSLTQPKLVAQQQLTANQNPPAIVHNANYGPYSSPYSNSNPYAAAGNPYAAAIQQNPYAALAGLNMAASSQYPIGVDQMAGGQLGGQLGGLPNYDYLNDAFMY